MINFSQRTLYDCEGNEIQVPEGHSVVCGKDSFAFIKTNNHSVDFVYREPDPTNEKFLEAKKG